jgi:hypothetical protein
VKKRLIALLVITPLLLSSQIYASNAAAKAGAKCSKLGSKSVVGSKTFTCIKSGNKLIWDKGITKSNSSGTASSLSAGIKAAIDSFGQFPKSNKAPQEISFNFGPNADKETSDLIVKNATATMGSFTVQIRI